MRGAPAPPPLPGVYILESDREEQQSPPTKGKKGSAPALLAGLSSLPPTFEIMPARPGRPRGPGPSSQPCVHRAQGSTDNMRAGRPGPSAHFRLHLLGS